MATTIPGRNHLVWLGPLVALTGGISYFLVFVWSPLLRDFPWVNLPLVWLGLVLSFLGLRAARARGRGTTLAAIGAISATLVAGLFHAYVFWLSATLPSVSAATAGLAVAPDFTLSDQHDRPLTLRELRGQNVVLVFYRGHW